MIFFACGEIDLNSARLLGFGRLSSCCPPDYLPVESPNGHQEESTTLYASGTRGLVSMPCLNPKTFFNLPFPSASICAAIKTTYLHTLNAITADLTCKLSSNSLTVTITEQDHRGLFLAPGVELVSCPIQSAQTALSSYLTFVSPRNEMNVIIWAACLPTLIPIFQRSFAIISSWKVSRARHHERNIPGKAFSLDGIDQTNPQSRAVAVSRLSGLNRFNDYGQSDKAYILERGIIGK